MCVAIIISFNFYFFSFIECIFVYDLLLVKSKRAEISVLSVSYVDCMIVSVCQLGMCVAIIISFNFYFFSFIECIFVRFSY